MPDTKKTTSVTNPAIKTRERIFDDFKDLQSFLKQTFNFVKLNIITTCYYNIMHANNNQINQQQYSLRVESVWLFSSPKSKTPSLTKILTE